MKKFKLDLIKSERAFKVWDSSPNSCIFNNPKFLSFYKDVEFYGVSKGEELLCCWPVYKKESSLIVPYFFYYFGPYWSKKAFALPIHSWLSLSKSVYECFLESFTKKYEDINFQLHYSLNDVRIFDWWNYGIKNKKKFLIKPRYSAIIDNIDKKKHEKIMSDYRYVRRYEIKNFKKYESKIERCEFNIESLLNLYLENLTDEENNENIKFSLSKLVDATEKNFGDIVCYKEASSNKIIYFSLILKDNNSTHLALNCAEKKWKKEGIMAWALNNLIASYKNKYSKFDFNGANSPLRGDDKHSYGASEKLFFQLKY